MSILLKLINYLLGEMKMDKNKFMKELEFLLLDISEEDRKEALEFYENYFTEAGEENESKIIKELGEPSRVAAMIKAGLKGNFDEHIEVGNQGFSNDDFKYQYEIKEVKQKEKTKTFDFDHITSTWKEKWQAMESRDKLILFVLLILCVVPLSFPILGVFIGLFSFGFAITLPLAIFFFGFWIITFILYCIAIVLIVIGVLQLFTVPGAGLICMGIGCIAIGFAKIFGKIASWFFKSFIPSIIDGISSMFNKIFGKEVSYENKV